MKTSQILKIALHILKYGDDEIRNEIRKKIKEDIFNELKNATFTVSFAGRVGAESSKVINAYFNDEFDNILHFTTNIIITHDLNDKLNIYTNIYKNIKKIIDKFKLLNYEDKIIKQNMNEFENFKEIIENAFFSYSFCFSRLKNIEQEVEQKITQITEQDWRPTETIPEDYYAL